MSASARPGAEMRGNSALRHRALGSLRQGHRAADRAASRRLFAPTRSAPTTPAPARPTCAPPRARTPPTGDSARKHRLRRPRRLPEPRRRARRRPPVGGHHGDEDLALRHRRGEERRAVHLGGGPEERRCRPSRRSASAVGDQMDIMVEFHSLWQLLPAMHDRQGARALRHVLARGSDQDGQPRRASSATPRSRPRRSAPRRRSARAGPSAISWKRMRPAS